MINFHLIIQNPWHNEKKNPWRDLYQRDIAVSKHKTLEIGIFRYWFNLVDVAIDLRFRGQSHAGPKLSISVLSWEFSIGLVDNRHWDYDNNTWEVSCEN